MSDKNQPVMLAGRGTCFPPITKSVPKEMLPVVDLDRGYRARGHDAGTKISCSLACAVRGSRSKTTDAEPGLIHLAKAGKGGWPSSTSTSTRSTRAFTCVPGTLLGFRHAILQAKSHVATPSRSCRPTISWSPAPAAAQDDPAEQPLGGTVVALLKVTPEQATPPTRRTAVEVLPIPEGVDLEAPGQLMRITDVTEKPRSEEVKSESMRSSATAFDPFTALENIEPRRRRSISSQMARAHGRPPRRRGAEVVRCSHRRAALLDTGTTSHQPTSRSP